MTLHLHFPLCTSQGIKVPFENKVMGLTHWSLVSPGHSFFPFLSFSLSVLLSGWLLGTQELYWLSVLIKEDQALLSALLSFRLGHHPEGTPGSCWGWTPAPRQHYWSGLSFSSLGDLPDPGIEPISPTLSGRFFNAVPPRYPLDSRYITDI